MLKKIVDRGQTGKLQLAALSHLANSYIASHNDRKLLQVLKSLKRNKNIVILKPDKTNSNNAISAIKRVVLDRNRFKIGRAHV